MIAEAGNTFQTDVVFFGVLIFMATGLVVVAFLDRVRAAVRTMAAGPALTDHDGATATMTDATV